MPATLRSTSRRVVAPCCSISSCGITVMVCGVSRSGSVYFGDAGASAVGAVTSMVSETAESSRLTVRTPVKR